MDIIASILTPPDDWPLFVAISRHASDTKKLRHYEILGQLLDEVPFLSDEDCGDATLEFVRDMMIGMQMNNEAKRVIRGMVWSAVVESLALASPKRMLLFMLDWVPLTSIIGHRGLGHESQPSLSGLGLPQDIGSNAM